MIHSSQEQPRAKLRVDCQLVILYLATLSNILSSILDKVASHKIYFYYYTHTYTNRYTHTQYICIYTNTHVSTYIHMSVNMRFIYKFYIHTQKRIQKTLKVNNNIRKRLILLLQQHLVLTVSGEGLTEMQWW